EKAALKARGVENVMSVNEAKPLARIFFMAAGSLSNLVTAIILFTLIALSGLPTIIGGSVGVANLSPDSPLANSGLQKGDLIETVNGGHFQDSTEFFEQLQALNGETIELTVQRGPEAEVVPLTFDLNLNPGTAENIEPYVFISNVVADSPASEAGIEPGDVVAAFNGEPFGAYEELADRTQENAGKEITLTLMRDGETHDVQLTPRVNPPAGQGAIGIVIEPAYENAQNGIVYVEGGSQQALVPLPFGEAVRYGFDRIGFFLESLVRLPVELIGGMANPEDARLISPLGISQIGAVFLQRSIEQNQPVIILEFIAVISVALGITNLLPLPMLDGGRILFVLIEIIRGRPISPEREGMVHLIGMALLLSLIVITFLNDIINPVTNLLP
ncbi:MAG: RIP metalloprotease RseP, partial [Anaerolineae bacterium]|nr:RIP metalloprotease RseP [Anaerolineae bacterium]